MGSLLQKGLESGVLVYLIIGTIIMLVPIIIQGFWCKIKYIKLLILAILLTFVGTLGTIFMYYIERGSFGGISFFGAVFIVPLVFVLIAIALRIPYGIIMDICAPAECAMLAVMKIQCLLKGCCGGASLNFWGKDFVFPSQMVELINGIILCFLLLILAYNVQNRGKIYPYYMILYGITRFVLNLFRDVGDGKIMFIPFGNFWAICSFIIGVAVLILMKWREKIKNTIKND